MEGYHGQAFDIHDDRNNYLTKISARISLKINEKSGGYIVNLKTPPQLEINPGRQILSFKIFKQFATTDEIADDIIKKINGLGQFAINRQYTIKGEVNSSYQPSSIYANFERKLGKYKKEGDDGSLPLQLQRGKQLRQQVSTTEIEKDNSFDYTVNGVKTFVRIVVFPYRDGSKVTYLLGAPYTVSDRISLTMNDIEAIRKDIEKITND
jgi:hypothetical protein